MNFTELQAEVVLWTKRPDLVAATRSAIRQATLFAHRSDNYWRDLNDGILVPISAAEGVILAEDYLPRLRSIASIYPYDSASNTHTAELENIAIDCLRDEYNVRKVNWFYGTAQGIRYNVSQLLPTLRIGYYRNPDVNPETFDSWIATIYPDVIVKWAVSLMFKTMGHTDEAAQELQVAQAMLQELVSGDFNIKGY